MLLIHNILHLNHDAQTRKHTTFYRVRGRNRKIKLQLVLMTMLVFLEYSCGLGLHSARHVHTASVMAVDGMVSELKTAADCDVSGWSGRMLGHEKIT